MNLILKDAHGFKEKSHRKAYCDMSVGMRQKILWGGGGGVEVDP